ncbi:MAG: nucleotidyl transferase AbiEii/AbiGii toxin family protein [Bacteroidota bacterium]|nr:nucleotidyl transferase AbiEii/AbiGii toxin family protein [Bacteroidota bacterium]
METLGKEILRRLSIDLKTAPERILREYWEIFILNELCGEDWSKSLGFKGGTSLRLAYGSPRFSDDLDFSLIGTLKIQQLFAWAKTISNRYQIEITDQVEKRNTILIEFRICDSALQQPMKMKLEISKRIVKNSKQEYGLRLLSSPASNLQVLLPVAGLESIWNDKIAALCNRKEPRDLFDLWYLSQKLIRPLPDDLPKLPGRRLRLVLGKYLPANYLRLIDELANR